MVRSSDDNKWEEKQRGIIEDQGRENGDLSKMRDWYQKNITDTIG